MKRLMAASAMVVWLLFGVSGVAFAHEGSHERSTTGLAAKPLLIAVAPIAAGGIGMLSASTLDTLRDRRRRDGVNRL